MNLETPNETRGAAREHKQNTFTLDQAAMRQWLTTKVTVTMRRWMIVAAGFVTFMLLLIALD